MDNIDNNFSIRPAEQTNNRLINSIHKSNETIHKELIRLNRLLEKFIAYRDKNIIEEA